MKLMSLYAKVLDKEDEVKRFWWTQAIAEGGYLVADGDMWVGAEKEEGEG